MQTSERQKAWGGGIVRLRPATDQNSSANLSRLITSMNNARSARALVVPWRVVVAHFEASRLYDRRRNLDYDALNVLSSWFIKTGQHMKAGVCTSEGMRKAEFAFYKRFDAPAHDLALSYSARARWATIRKRKEYDKNERRYVRDLVQAAVLFELPVWCEYDLLCAQKRPAEEVLQGLRQFVRVLKDSGKALRSIGDGKEARELWQHALTLAEDKANSVSQARQLRALLRN